MVWIGQIGLHGGDFLVQTHHSSVFKGSFQFYLFISMKCFIHPAMYRDYECSLWKFLGKWFTLVTGWLTCYFVYEIWELFCYWMVHDFIDFISISWFLGKFRVPGLMILNCIPRDWGDSLSHKKRRRRWQLNAKMLHISWSHTCGLYISMW